jgi:hypothetical protein
MPLSNSTQLEMWQKNFNFVFQNWGIIFPKNSESAMSNFKKKIISLLTLWEILHKKGYLKRLFLVGIINYRLKNIIWDININILLIRKMRFFTFDLC